MAPLDAVIVTVMVPLAPAGRFSPPDTANRTPSAAVSATEGTSVAVAADRLVTTTSREMVRPEPDDTGPNDVDTGSTDAGAPTAFCRSSSPAPTFSASVVGLS